MRFYHSGEALHPPIEYVNGQPMVKAPPKYWRVSMVTGKPEPEYVPCQPGSILTTYGGQFSVVPPGGFVDLPSNITEKNVKDLVSPHLIPEGEAIAAGLAKVIPEQVVASRPVPVAAPVPAPVQPEHPVSSHFAEPSVIVDSSHEHKRGHGRPPKSDVPGG